MLTGPWASASLQSMCVVPDAGAIKATLYRSRRSGLFKRLNMLLYSLPVDREQQRREDISGQLADSLSVYTTGHCEPCTVAIAS